MALFWNKTKQKIESLELQEQLELTKTQLHNRITNCNKRINRIR